MDLINEKYKNSIEFEFFCIDENYDLSSMKNLINVAYLQNNKKEIILIDKDYRHNQKLDKIVFYKDIYYYLNLNLKHDKFLYTKFKDKEYNYIVNLHTLCITYKDKNGKLKKIKLKKLIKQMLNKEIDKLKYLLIHVCFNKIYNEFIIYVFNIKDNVLYDSYNNKIYNIVTIFDAIYNINPNKNVYAIKNDHSYIINHAQTRLYKNYNLFFTEHFTQFKINSAFSIVTEKNKLLINKPFITEIYTFDLKMREYKINSKILSAKLNPLNTFRVKNDFIYVKEKNKIKIDLIKHFCNNDNSIIYLAII